MSERFGIKKWTVLACLLGMIVQVSAQEDAELPPPPKRPGVQITFIPPPLAGTLSLGIYSKAGKLVRTLHREARTKEFVAGLNGLITWWDGKDDSGAIAPPGKYFARGFAVGAVEFEGVAFHFNDWIEDEKSPRIRRIHWISHYGGGFTSSPWIAVTLADGKKGSVTIDKNGKTYGFRPQEKESPSEPSAEEVSATAAGVRDVEMIDHRLYGLRDGQLVQRGQDSWNKIDLKPVENAIYVVAMTETEGVGWWLIDRTTTGIVLKRFAADGTFLRSLAIPPTEPQPVALCADGSEQFIILLEEAPDLQRVRTLERRHADEPKDNDLDAPKASEWAVTMSKIIRASDKLADIQSELKTEADEPFAAVEKINVRLLPNQLVRNASTRVDVGVAVDAKGSFLRAVDGLPLKRITETLGLKWVAMMKDTRGKGVTIFQSDGAVVEEFKARKLANMMAFDAGDYEWAGK